LIEAPSSINRSEIINLASLIEKINGVKPVS
jgi:hypothetical protein